VPLPEIRVALGPLRAIVITPPLPLPAKVNALVLSLYSSAVFSESHSNPAVPPKLFAWQFSPPAIKVRLLGRTTTAADSRLVLRLPTSRKVSVAVLKI